MTPQERFFEVVQLYGKMEFAEMLEKAHQLSLEYPTAFEVWNVLAAAHKAVGNFFEAEHGFRRAFELNPAFSEASYNLGVVLQEQGKLDEAIAAYRSAVEANPAYAVANYNIGNALKEQGKLDEAITAYQRELEINPTCADAYNNMGNALKEQGKFDEAISAYQRALEINPAYADAYNNIGVTLKEQGKLDEAIAAYQRALEIRPGYADAYNNMGFTLQEQGKFDEAISAYQRALEFNPADAVAEARLLRQQQHICDFSVDEKLEEASSRLGVETAVTATFAALPWEDNPHRHHRRAMKWSRENYKKLPLPLPAQPKTRPQRLKIGYFSADFHDHATMYLMAGLLRTHDRTTFEIFAYSYGQSKSGQWRKRAERDVDHFFDVTDYSDRRIVDVVRSHDLHIAIDLKGYTKHTRSQIFQYRLAPIQISYLGYPGTMGAEFIDYIIADPVVIPAEQRQHYSERIIYLPHSYQPNDNERPITETTTNRSDVDLPSDAFIFCCFNNSYKISPSEFDIWMRLLHKVDGSSLWLLRSNKWAESNLRKEAAARGIDPSRLAFAPKIPHSEHLARHQHADLFIDTFNYNAHTTASDALWSGLPVITKRGKQFSARVAASLLTAVGLPELITETEGQYEKLILELAENPERLASVKRKLEENRLRMPLFDTERYTRNFENGIIEAYNRYFNGFPPDDIWVSENNQ